MYNLRTTSGRQRSWALPMLALGVMAFTGACGDDPVVPPAMAERATFTLRIENVGSAFTFLNSGAFDTPVGDTAAAPIGPGGSYSFDFSAPPGARLSLATMFVPSNDFFFAPEEGGIELYAADSTQVSGDVTSQFRIWDAGTEVNQEPGLGPDQVQRQDSANVGAADTDTTVRLAANTFGNLPAVQSVIQVVITPTAPTEFSVTVTNVSNSTTLATSDAATQAVPLSPGVFVVHTEDAPLFTVGTADIGDGLEAIAEDGDPSGLASALDAETGVTVPLSPGVFATYTGSQPLFTTGSPDNGDGLEAIAEDGDPSGLATVLSADGDIVTSGVFNTAVGGTGPGAIGPGGAYETMFEARVGDRLSFATMFVPSNDLFFAPTGEGIELFVGGVATSGDITSMVALYDAGTEVNEQPGVGLNQVQRQAAADTGPDEGGNVALIANVNDGFTYPAVATVIRVTLTAVPSS